MSSLVVCNMAYFVLIFEWISQMTDTSRLGFSVQSEQNAERQKCGRHKTINDFLIIMKWNVMPMLCAMVFHRCLISNKINKQTPKIWMVKTGQSEMWWHFYVIFSVLCVCANLVCKSFE